jgi:hypothetical protein
MGNKVIEAAFHCEETPEPAVPVLPREAANACSVSVCRTGITKGRAISQVKPLQRTR